MAQKVRVIPATINRATSAPIDARAKRKVAGYARVSTELEEQQSSYRDIPMVGPQLAFLSKTELTFPDLFEYPIIIPSQDTVAKNYYINLFKQYNTPRGADIEASGADRRILLTERNLGISFLPRECVKSEIDDRLLFPLKLKETLLERKLLLITSKTRPLSNAARALVQMLI